jgi:surfactin synthase thioesterase subunit
VLADHVEVVPIQLPGRENRLRERPVSNVRDLSREIVSAALPYLDCPFAFFGHSMGALVAFECARELRRRGLAAPRRLFVSAKRAPHLARDKVLLGGLPDDALICALQERYGLDVSGEMRPLIELMLPTIRADIMAVDDYVYTPEAPFDFPIVAFGGERDRCVLRDDLAQWRTHATTDFALHMLPGAHFFLRTAQEQLVEILRNEMALIQ